MKEDAALRQVAADVPAAALFQLKNAEKPGLFYCPDSATLLPVMNTLPIGLIGDVGGGELLVVFAAILLLFGGKRLPSIARTIGKTMEHLRKTSRDFKYQLLNADEPPPDDIIQPAHDTQLHSQAGTELRAVRPGLAESRDHEEASLPESNDSHPAHTPTPPQETPPRDLAG